MVLADLGRKITAALRSLSSATVINEEVIISFATYYVLYELQPLWSSVTLVLSYLSPYTWNEMTKDEIANAEVIWVVETTEVTSFQVVRSKQECPSLCVHQSGFWT